MIKNDQDLAEMYKGALYLYPKYADYYNNQIKLLEDNHNNKMEKLIKDSDAIDSETRIELIQYERNLLILWNQNFEDLVKVNNALQEIRNILKRLI